MARKPKRNQEAYRRLGFLPRQKELNNTNIEQDDSVTECRCDTRVGSKTKEIKEGRRGGKKIHGISYFYFFFFFFFLSLMHSLRREQQAANIFPPMKRQK